tara:strand:+ start:953 stop:1258 length:306 start_codon:yes stop_codon:yes gene_type:complete
MNCKNPGVKHKCTCGDHNVPTYEEDNLGSVSIRTFNNETLSNISFVEEGDRWIEAINENDWKVIIDNEVQSLEPKKIIQIPGGMPYSLIKGTSKFSLKITK